MSTQPTFTLTELTNALQDELEGIDSQNRLKTACNLLLSEIVRSNRELGIKTADPTEEERDVMRTQFLLLVGEVTKPLVDRCYNDPAEALLDILKGISTAVEREQERKDALN